MKIALITLMLLILQTCMFAETYHVGPAKSYQKIGDVPLSNLKGGDSVVIYYRDEPYHEKWVITAQGSQTRPVVFLGVSDVSGQLPVIDGKDAITPSGMNFWSEGRGVIKIGGSNNPPDSIPSNIIIENLEIKNGTIPNKFTGRNGVTSWDTNAAAIFLEKGENITIRNCVLHNCGNGFFSAHQSRNVTVEYCYIYGNGNPGRIYEHNNYTESFGITFQFNRFGPLREGAEGNNLKDRSAGCVIRYNWIESGNRQLDLVDSDYEAFTGSTDYHSTFVYGNIIVEPDGAGNSQIIHYGGDSGEKSRYRKGMLYLYHNTIVSTRSGNTTLLRLSSTDESADVRDNIIFVSSSGSYLGIVDNEGTVELAGNWIKSGWKVSHSNSSAAVSQKGTNIDGNNPGFTDLNQQNFSPAAGSTCINRGISVADASVNDHQVKYQYQKHQMGVFRVADHTLDIGALEYGLLPVVNRKTVSLSAVYDNCIRRTNVYMKKTVYGNTGNSWIILNGRFFHAECLNRSAASNFILSR